MYLYFHQASTIALQSQQSAIHSLNSADSMRNSSQRELNNSGIYDDGAKFTGFDDLEHVSLSTSTSTRLPTSRVQNPGYGQIKRDDEEEKVPKIPLPSPFDMLDENLYMPLQYNDDRSSVSRVNNLGLESGLIYDDTAVPLMPKRDYHNPTIMVQEGLVVNKSSRKTRTPQPAEAPIDQMDSIQREKTVRFETQFQRGLQPMRDESIDDKEKEMRGKLNSEAPNSESVNAYIQWVCPPSIWVDRLIYLTKSEPG